MTEWVECYTWDRMFASTRAGHRGVVYGVTERRKPRAGESMGSWGPLPDFFLNQCL